MQQYLQNKKGLVQGVFNKVFDKYDLMNDFMSFGIHRIWSVVGRRHPSRVVLSAMARSSIDRARVHAARCAPVVTVANFFAELLLQCCNFMNF